MKKIFPVLGLIVLFFMLMACPNLSDPIGDVISIEAIPGVTAPAYGGTPVATITETDQYTGTVSWSPTVISTFGAETVYTATITLTAKSGYTLTGVTADFFTVAGTTSVANSADSGVVTAVFPKTATAPSEIISIAAIPGVTAPAYGGTPVDTITKTDQYTGTVSWSPTVSSTFGAETVYTATITLTAKSGYTLTGVTADFFTVAGTTSVTNDADSGIVTAQFPATGAAPDVVVVFQSAVQVGGVSTVTDTASLTLTFDTDPATLSSDDITLTGATKGALSGSGTTRSLAISDITVDNGANVSVSITSPSGYSISGSPQTAEVYRAPYIGMLYQGGVIGYIFQSGDTGYASGEVHGIIAATSDQSTGILWSASDFDIASADPNVSRDIGRGETNTDAILAETGSENNAAKVARAHDGGGYSDWFLPSYGELYKFFTNKDEIGGFASASYWSSSQGDNTLSSTHAQVSTFSSNGSYRNEDRTGTYYVRAARYF